MSIDIKEHDNHFVLLPVADSNNHDAFADVSKCSVIYYRLVFLYMRMRLTRLNSRIYLLSVKVRMHLFTRERLHSWIIWQPRRIMVSSTYHDIVKFLLILFSILLHEYNFPFLCLWNHRRV